MTWARVLAGLVLLGILAGMLIGLVEHLTRRPV
jgi:hypothetical protein